MARERPADAAPVGSVVRRLVGGGFRTTLAATVSALLLVCAVFATLAWIQGPKLSSTQLDTARLVAADDQQVRFFANQPVARVDADQVTVTPAADVSVSTSGDVIAVQFANRLDSATDYRISISGVTSLYQDRAADFETSFRTDVATFTYLDRAGSPGGQDTIVRTSVSGGDRDVLFTGERIASFAEFDRVLVVASTRDDGTSTVTVVSRTDGTRDEMVLPPGAVIDHLAGSRTLGVLGFTVSIAATGAENELYGVDLAGEQTPTPVPALDGTPVQTMDWLFLPDTATAAIRTTDDDLLLADLTGSEPVVPVGSYASLDSASPDGTVLVVGDVFGSLALTLADGIESRLEASPVRGEQPFGGEIALLGDGLERVQRVAVFTAGTGRFASYLVLDTGSESRVLYESLEGRGSIEDFSVSPNGQYAAVTIVPDVSTSVSDGSPVDPMSTTVASIVIDIATGTVLGSVAGFAVSW